MPLSETLSLRRETEARLKDAERSWGTIWNYMMSSKDIDRAFGQWLLVVSQTAAVQHEEFARLARSYLTELNLDVAGFPQFNGEKFTASMHATAVAAVKAAIDRGESVERAMAIGRSLSYGSYSRTLMDAQREQIMSSAIKDRNTPGWRRVGVGGCDFCDMLILRGAVYSQATAFFASHDRCRCSAEPALDESSPAVKPKKAEKDLEELTLADSQALFKRLQESIFGDMVGSVRTDEEFYEGDVLVRISPREALRRYVGEGDYSYDPLNTYLRHGKRASFRKPLDLNEDYRKSIQTMIGSMDQLFKESGVVSPADQWVSRGISHSLAGTLEGHVIADPGYTSATVDPTVSEGYGRFGWRLFIKIPKGVRYIQGSPGESEIILNRGTKFLVRRVDSAEKMVEMEVLP